MTSFERIFMALVFVLCANTVAYAEFKGGPTLLFDSKSGEVLFEDRAGEPWYPASLTKMMTAYVIFKKIRDGKLSLDQDVIVSELAHSQPASKIGVPAGKTVKLDFALQAMLVYSANDMAYVLAEAGGNSVPNFAKEMNQIAQELGLTATHFVNPNGLFDPRQISSARDMGVIAALLINQYPEHAHYFSQEYVAVGKRRLPNHNSLIRNMPEAVGMKTGFVCNSGYNLVGSAVRDGRQLVSVLLGARNSGQRAAISKKLLETGFLMPGDAKHAKVAEIVNQPFGAIVPADLTVAVCKGRPPNSQVSAAELHGWAVSFGTFDTLLKADMALRGRMISPASIDTTGQDGVIKMPGGAGYSAMLWGLDQITSLAMCAQYKSEGAPCDVLPDELIRQIALSAPIEGPAAQSPTDQGSDDDQMAAPKKRVRLKSGRIRKSLN